MSPTGIETGSLFIGDAIQQIQVAEDSTIWVSYFDEGVLGDFSSIVGSGLVRWNAAGEILYRYQRPPGIGPITDCYALNVVSAREQWICYYTDFPLVRILDGRVAGVWRGAPSGVKGLAIRDDLVVFYGGYYQRDVCSVFRMLPRGTLALEGEFILSDRGGLKATHVVGRRDRLLVLEKARLYQAAVGDFLRS